MGGGRRGGINQWLTFDQGVVTDTCCCFGNEEGPCATRTRALKTTSSNRLGQRKGVGPGRLRKGEREEGKGGGDRECED